MMNSLTVFPLRRCLLLSLALFLAPLSLPANDRIEAAVEKFICWPEMRQVELSPNGRYVSWLARKDGDFELTLFVYDTQEGKGRGIRAEGITDIRSYDWVDNQYIVYRPVYGSKFGRWEMYCLDVESGKVSRLDGLEDYRYAAFLAHPAVGLEKEFFAVMWDRKLEGVRALRVSVPRGGVSTVVDDVSNVRRYFVNHLTNEVLGYTVPSGYDAVDYYYRPDSKSAWSELDIPGRAEFLSFMGDGSMLVTTDEGSKAGCAGLTFFDPREGQFTAGVLRDEPFDLTPLYLIHNQFDREVAGIAYHAERPKVFWLDPQYGQIAALIDQVRPDHMNVVLGFIEGNRYAVIRSSSDTDPGSLLKLDLQQGKLEPWLRFRPSIDPKEMRPKQFVRMPTRDGAEVYGYLTLPADDAKDIPVIVDVIGGPGVMNTAHFNAEAQLYAALGYGFLEVNYRGCTGYGDPYKGDSLLFAMEHVGPDVVDAALWLVDQGISSKGRIGLYGGSFGGHGVYAAAKDEKADGLFGAIVGYAGVYDWAEQIKDDQKDLPEETFNAHYGNIETLAPKYDALSPVHFADRIQAPSLIIHGNFDWRVEAQQAKLMAKALEKAGKPVELEIQNWGQHGNWLDEMLDRDAAMRIASFFDKHLRK